MDVKAIFTGFDSAWTDNPSKPGAIANITLDHNDRLELSLPEPATFDYAENSILNLAKTTPVHVVGIDQPTIVPNATGSRPAEKVVASLISKMKGGVQPSNRSKEKMFGDNASIWPFLKSLPHEQSPTSAVRSQSGAFILEVYPALAILGLFSYFVNRGRLPKYNPERRKTFQRCDWRRLTWRLGKHGSNCGIDGLHEWASSMTALESPSKADQDGVDAVICAIQALHWWKWGFERSAIIGDEKLGYIVGAVNDWTRAYLQNQAAMRAVPFQKEW